MKTVLEYGILACDAIMQTYKPEDLPPKNVFFYHQGVFLAGMERIYSYTKDEKYFNYIKSYIDNLIDSDGNIIGFNAEDFTDDMPMLAKQSLQLLDHKMPSVLLYNLFERTGDERYKKAISMIAESMHFWPVNEYGGYWHMMMQHNQMWLDSAYMVGPLSVMYAEKFGDDVLRERAIKQIFIMDEHMKKSQSGLYYHGWDPTKEAEWADKETGCSQNVWGRALGWYAVAILELLDHIPENHSSVDRLKRIEKELLVHLADFQDEETGMWYQVTDMPDKKGNWVESSSTCLFIYSYAKAIRKGILDKKFEKIMEKAYDGITKTILYENGKLALDRVCVGTCIESGDYEHYISRQCIKNDLHGMGAFLLMCAEMYEYNNHS